MGHVLAGQQWHAQHESPSQCPPGAGRRWPHCPSLQHSLLLREILEYAVSRWLRVGMKGKHHRGPRCAAEVMGVCSLHGHLQLPVCKRQPNVFDAFQLVFGGAFPKLGAILMGFMMQIKKEDVPRTLPVFSLQEMTLKATTSCTLQAPSCPQAALGASSRSPTWRGPDAASPPPPSGSLSWVNTHLLQHCFASQLYKSIYRVVEYLVLARNR